MRFLPRLTGLAALVLISGYTYYRREFPTYHVRYRLTVDAVVDGLPRSGSGVVDITTQLFPMTFLNLGGGDYGHTMRGYAVTLDLGRAGLIYIVNSHPDLSDPITGDYIYRHATDYKHLAESQFNFHSAGVPAMAGYIPRFNALVEKFRQSGVVKSIPLDQLPMIVRFAHPGEINSIEELDPKDLSSALGTGVSLVRATVALTDEPVSPMPSVWPTWLADATFDQVQVHGRFKWGKALPLRAFKGG